METRGERKKMKRRESGRDRARVNLNETQHSTSEREVEVTERTVETTERWSGRNTTTWLN